MSDGLYETQFWGRFVGIRRWEDLARLWQVVLASDQPWYVSVPGEAVPDAPLSAEMLAVFVNELDALLRREHEEASCNVVYVDQREQPTFVKIYDPALLGSGCGSSSTTPRMPGWVMSHLAPEVLDSVAPLAASRRRWWQSLFSA